MKKLFVLFSLLTFSAAAPMPLIADTNVKTEPRAIRVTPPAPKISDAERQMELAKRRARVFEAMADNSMMILFSGEPKNYAGDVDFLFRQENNLYYLTNLRQRNAMIVLTKNGSETKEILFLPKRNPANETWNGKTYSREDATRISGVKTMIDFGEFDAFLQSVKEKRAFTSKNDSISIAANAKTLYLLLPEDEMDGDGKAEFRREYEFSKNLTGYEIENAQPIFAELRSIKSPLETKLLQHAIDITTEAQMRSMAMVGRAKWEYEVQAEVEYTFRRRNADYWGYPSIVGCGANATTLHYEEAQGAVKPNDLLLMDVGAEYDHYTADVTRTFPVSGKFSKEQAEIYQIVYDAQESAAKTIKPGAYYNAPSKAAAETLKKGLASLGLITAPNATFQILFQGKPVNVPQYQLWYMHGWGHWLGMNVHDVGGDGATVLQKGMVTTNEPGIYIREDALDYIADTPENKAFLAKIRPAFEKYKNIGVRIEDDMLVTDTGVEWMTKNLPRKIDEIEAFMAQASKEMNYSRFKIETNPALAIFNNDLMNAKIARRGWIWTGKEIALSASNHYE
jgi:Xaa-Pro aminopeptidase